MKKTKVKPMCIVRGCAIPAEVHGCLCLGCFYFLTRGNPAGEPFAANSRAYALAMETAEDKLQEKLRNVLFER